VHRPLAAVVVVLALLAAAAAFGACGDSDNSTSTATTPTTADRTTRQAQDRTRTVLGQIDGAVPRAARGDARLRGSARRSRTAIAAFLDDVMANIDSYWTRTLTSAGLPRPSVKRRWVPPQRRIPTACGQPAGDTAAFYCSADDTIYVAQAFAAALYAGLLRGLPGEVAGYGYAAGDFAVAYVVAHEYAHNIQQELGILQSVQLPAVAPLELQADCMSGTWANSVYDQGKISQEELVEMINTALAVGDFDFGNAQHHGTPQERAAAVVVGLRAGDPAVCSQYLPT
jgi:predicted metalloprotease